MKLASFLSETQLTQEEFARRIGAANGRTVQRYILGRIPAPEMMLAIQRETGGRVGPADFYPEA